MKPNGLIKHILIIAVVCIGIVAITGRIDPEAYPDWDLVHCRAMAAAAPGISDDIPMPYAYRLLGPYIAGSIPIDDTDAFYLLAIVCALILLVSFYLFLCRSGISSPAALYATTLFAFNWYFFAFNIWDYFQLNDLLALLSLVWSFRAMSERNWLSFSAALVFGILCRMTAMVMIPVALVYLWERRLLRIDGIKVVLSALPAFAVFVLIRLLVEASGGAGIYQAFMVHLPRLYDPGAWFGLLVSPFAPLTLLPLIFLTETAAYLRDKKYLLVFFALIVLGTFQGANNERLVAPTFVVFYMLMGFLIERTPLKNGSFIVLLIAVTFFRGFYHLAAPGSPPSPELDALISSISIAVVSGTAFWLKLRRSRSLLYT